VRRAPESAGTECQTDQRGATLMGLSIGLAYVCRSCPCNAHNALCNRHGVAPPPFTSNFDEAHAYLTSIEAEVRETFVAYRAVWQDGWISKWPKLKQLAIQKSADVDDVRPGDVDAMVKREIGMTMPTKARLIQYSPNPATQAVFGPEFYSLQKTYTSILNRREVFPGVRVTFGSGMNSDDLGAWMDAALADNPNAHFYERDGKNWDSTMQRPHIDLRKHAYACAGEKFLEFVEAGYRVKGRDPRGALKYILQGTVKSGHNDTTLGNSLVNGLLAATALKRCGLRGDIIVAGDDLLCVITGDFDEDALAAVERTLGIVPEYRKFAVFTDVSFISGVWFNNGHKTVFTPKPGRLLARLFWTVRPPYASRTLQYVNGVVAGLRPTAGDMPVIGAFLDAHYRANVETDAIVEWRYKTQLMRASEGSRGDYLNSFCARYGLSPTQVREAEAFLASCHGKVGFISHPTLDRIVEVDCSDILMRPLTVC